MNHKSIIAYINNLCDLGDGQRQYERQAEREVLQEMLRDSKARDLTCIIKSSGEHQSEITDLTVKRYKELTGGEGIDKCNLTKDGHHIRWEIGFDKIATDRGYQSGEELYNDILEVKRMKDRIRGLK